jgi:hypothetical protein
MKRFPCGFGQAFSDAGKLFVGVKAKNELHPVFVPAIQMLGRREIGVTAKDDLSEARFAALVDRQVKEER